MQLSGRASCQGAHAVSLYLSPVLRPNARCERTTASLCPSFSLQIRILVERIETRQDVIGVILIGALSITLADRMSARGGIMNIRAVIASLLFAFVAAPHIAVAGPLSCDALGRVEKPNSATPAKLHIVNRSREPISVDWINYSGNRVAQLRLAPAERSQQLTFATHTWVASTGTGKCLCALTLDADATWTIEDGSCSVGSWQAQSSSEQKPPYETTASYQKTLLRGWTVYVSRRLLENAQAYNDTKKVLDKGLRNAIEKLPSSAIDALRSTKIWLELSDPTFPGGVYHPSRQWLEANGMNPDKAISVQFDRQLVRYVEQQPAAVLHELSHAFHDRVLGSNHLELIFRYRFLCSDGRLKNVRHVTGSQQPAYALTNNFEFFAEMSEAYFWKNDFFPFDRADLKQFDPGTSELIGRLWKESSTGPALIDPADDGERQEKTTCDTAWRN